MDSYVKTENVNIENKEVFWSRFADDFEKRSNYVVGKKTIDIMKNSLREQQLTGKILELGCGNGTYSKIAAESADQLFATDFSDEMVEVSSKTLNLYKNIVVEKQNCFSLSYADASFDNIFMVNLLHIIPDPEKALMECKRVIKPNGNIVVISLTANGMNIINKFRMFYRYSRTWGKFPANSRVLTVNNTINYLNDAGFTPLIFKLIGSDCKAVFVSGKSN